MGKKHNLLVTEFIRELLKNLNFLAERLKNLLLLVFAYLREWIKCPTYSLKVVDSLVNYAINLDFNDTPLKQIINDQLDRSAFKNGFAVFVFY